MPKCNFCELQYPDQIPSKGCIALALNSSETGLSYLVLQSPIIRCVKHVLLRLENLAFMDTIHPACCSCQPEGAAERTLYNSMDGTGISPGFRTVLTAANGDQAAEGWTPTS